MRGYFPALLKYRTHTHYGFNYQQEQQHHQHTITASDNCYFCDYHYPVNFLDKI